LAENEAYTAAAAGIYKGHTEVVRLLLEQAGLGIDDQGTAAATGNSLLMWASIWNSPDVASLLLRAGADTSLVNSEGDTALSLARKRGCQDIVLLLQSHGAAE
jgi:ankyrin repeat protein